MPIIATLTMNPTVDIAYEVDKVEPTKKLRSNGERHDPGGGGINVARVFVRLGGTASCYYLTGGATGMALDSLLESHQLVTRPIRIAGATRVTANVHENSSGHEYRFVPAGPTIAKQEWQACLDALAEAECDYLVASGSLPAGVPDDFYARVAEVAQKAGFRMVLDTSGPALIEGLSRGGLHLIKPNLIELSQFSGQELNGRQAVETAARHIVDSGKVDYVAVTMGEDGGVLASAEGTHYFPAIPVIAKSAVGAGDSFTAAMVYALATGKTPRDAFRYGMAAGSAAVLTPGTDLCRPEDIERLLESSAG